MSLRTSPASCLVSLEKNYLLESSLMCDAKRYILKIIKKHAVLCESVIDFSKDCFMVGDWIGGALLHVPLCQKIWIILWFVSHLACSMKSCATKPFNEKNDIWCNLNSKRHAWSVGWCSELSPFRILNASCYFSFTWFPLPWITSTFMYRFIRASKKKII